MEEPTQEPSKPQKHTLAQKWTSTLLKARRPILKGVTQLADVSTRNPWMTIALASLLTVTLVMIGIFTNITFESDDEVLFTPFKSVPPYHKEWINTQSDFPDILRDQVVLLHRNGENIMDDCRALVSKAFDVLETLEGLKGFSEVCRSEANACPWSGITQFFNNSRDTFNKADLETNEACLEALSVTQFPNGEFVLPTKIFGVPEYDETTSMLTSAQSAFFIMGFPLDEDQRDAVIDLETEAIDAFFDLDDQLKKDDSSHVVVMEQFNDSTFPIEFGKGFLENIPFLATAFTLMGIFTSVIFFKRDPVESRMAVGLGATVTVTLAMAASFGLLFICGVPMTSIHGMLPFILVGIGLDDSFIIINEFYRLPRSLPIEERINKTITEIGLSIVTTTLTSAVAFGLGCISSIPAVYWLCLYAFPAITFVFFYTVTMFIAIIVIDERRVDANRRDFLCCISMKNRGTTESNTTDENLEETPVVVEDPVLDRLMAKYADFLMRPLVKAVVLVVFAGTFAVCAWSTTLLKQEFTIELVLPQGSYAVSFLDSLEAYTSIGGFKTTLFFRNIDQSTTENQQAMEAYVNDMVALKEISSQPDHFWVRDFQAFSKNNSALEGLTFEEQMDAFLELPIYGSLYGRDIARNERGEVTASRILVRIDTVDSDDVKGQIDALDHQERVARERAVNQDLAGKDWAFFSFDENYFIWSFFKACPKELTQTTISGVVAVTLISIVANHIGAQSSSQLL